MLKNLFKEFFFYSPNTRLGAWNILALNSFGWYNLTIRWIKLVLGEKKDHSPWTKAFPHQKHRFNFSEMFYYLLLLFYSTQVFHTSSYWLFFLWVEIIASLQDSSTYPNKFLYCCVVCMVSILPFISSSSNLLILGNYSKDPSYKWYHCHHFPLFSTSQVQVFVQFFAFILLSISMEISTWWQVFLKLLFIRTCLVCWCRLGDLFVFQNPIEFYVSFFWQDSSFCIYYL